MVTWGRMRRIWLRTLVSAAVVLLFAGWPAGLCVLSSCGPDAAADAGDPHRCCGAGMRAQAPACCMSGDASPPATKAAAAPVVAPPTALPFGLSASAAGPSILPVVVSDPGDHSPPLPIVLRV